MYNLTNYQQHQLEVIGQIEESLAKNQAKFTMVEPVADFVNDDRICLTSVHFPDPKLINKVYKEIIEPLKKISPEHFYYPSSSIHATIKNIRVISNPPTFNEKDVEIVKKVFNKVIPKHKSFQAYYYRLLLFPHNLALIGTTDQELDNIIFDLETELNKVGVPDNKIYLNKKYFFSNITLIRFANPISEDFKNKVKEISASIKPFNYEIDSISLVTSNAVMKRVERIADWKLD